MKTLPDYLREDLRYLSIGLNPSLVSVEAGYYFANPRNRFWKALNGSRLLGRPLEPGIDAMDVLFNQHHIGFTDLVKRPTPMGNALRAADFREGAPLLKEMLLQYKPLIAWFHGQVAYQKYLKYADGIDRRVQPGLQKRAIGRTRVFVTPNPSPANARYSLADLIRYYNEMVSFQIREAFGVGSG